MRHPTITRLEEPVRVGWLGPGCMKQSYEKGALAWTDRTNMFEIEREGWYRKIGAS